MKAVVLYPFLLKRKLIRLPLGGDAAPTIEDMSPLGEVRYPYAPPEADDGDTLATSAYRLPLEVGGATSMMLPLGLTIVSGATNVGKTRFLSALEQAAGVVPISCGEPFSASATIPDPHFYTADAALVAAVRLQHAQGVLPAIDSLRAVLFEIEGPATSKGMTATFFTRLTYVSNALAAQGFTVMATVNPMNEERDFVTEFLGRISAAVPAFIEITSVSGSGAVPDSVSGFVTTRPKRNRTPFVLRPGASRLTREEASEPVEILISRANADPFVLSNSSVNAIKETKQ